MKYDVILIDPPWKYDNKRTGGAMSSGSSQKYGVLSISDLCRLPIKELAKDDACIFLWVTVPFLMDCYKLFEAWGVKYKTAFFWNKLGRLGLGHWFRSQVEFMAFGIIGKVKPFRSIQRNHLSLPSVKHSHKPGLFRDVIEEAVRLKIRDPKFVELFATHQAPGWDAVGYALDGKDIFQSIKELIKT